MEIGFSVRALTTTEIPRVRREELIMGIIFHLKKHLYLGALEFLETLEKNSNQPAFVLYAWR